MNLHITFESKNRELQRIMLEHFKSDESVKVDLGSKRINKERVFSLKYCFYERTELNRFIKDHGPKQYALVGFGETLGCDYILIDKSTNTGVCGEYKISLKESDLEYRSFHNYSNTNILKNINIWEKWDDLLLRLPLETQHDIFTNSLCNMCYFEIEEVLNGHKNFVDQFIEQEKFMAYMIENKYVNFQEVHNYMNARIQCGIHINKV